MNIHEAKGLNTKAGEAIQYSFQLLKGGYRRSLASRSVPGDRR